MGLLSLRVPRKLFLLPPSSSQAQLCQGQEECPEGEMALDQGWKLSEMPHRPISLHFDMGSTLWES